MYAHVLPLKSTIARNESQSGDSPVNGTAARLLGLLLAGSLLQGCELQVRTAHPVGVSAGAQPDLRLIGIWAFRDENGRHQTRSDRAHDLVFVQMDESGTMSARLVRWKWSAGDAKWSDFDLIPGRLGELRLLNLDVTERDPARSQPAPSAQPPRYLPLLYRFGRNGNLELYYLSNDVIASAINNGRIAGTVEQPHKEGENSPRSADDDYIVIKADSPELDRFIAAAAPELFSQYYGTLVPIHRPAIETLTRLEPLRPLLGTVAVVSIPRAVRSTIDRETVGADQPGHVTVRRAQWIEARFQQGLRGHPLQANLRRAVVAQARQNSSATILDGGVAPAHWGAEDYRRFARQGVRTVLEVGIESIDPVLDCYDGRCTPDKPVFWVATESVARLISVADQHVLWESRGEGSIATGGTQVDLKSTVSDDSIRDLAARIVKRVYGPGEAQSH